MKSVRHSSESENHSNVDQNGTDEANEVIDHYYPSTVSSGYMSKYMSKSMQNDLELATYPTSDTRYLCKPIIFNHKTFSTKYGAHRPTTREGTDEDVKRLCHTFQGLNNCDIVDVYVDKTELEIEDILKKAAQADHSDYSCFVVIVLTHGDESKLSAYDATYPTKNLWKPLIKTDRPNPTLAGKPKLFFIQACRGAELDPGQYTMPDGGSAYNAWSKKIPLCADILIAYSSFLGYKSVRNTELGSWFIQTLCECVDNFKDVHDLLTMLTMVQHSVANTKAFQGDKKQIPCIETTLTKKLYLTKSTVIVAPRARRVHGHGTREIGGQRMQLDEIGLTEESGEPSKDPDTTKKERTRPRLGFVGHGVVIGILACVILKLMLKQK